ncbi:MAG TPA: protein-methionine-sulfoxide reductase catalytic subunit MsrP [Alphaproteobacteria bacterium]
MLIKRKPGWALPESAATPEAKFRNRRTIVKGMIAGGLIAGGGVLGARLAGIGEDGGIDAVAAAEDDPNAARYPAERNERLSVDRAVTEERITSTYNNFYEFGSHKNVWKAAQKLAIRPWEVLIDGLVETEVRIQADELIARMPLEERITRHRCVEAWGMTIPWTGFPLARLVELAKPLGSAKYLKMTTFFDPEVAPGHRQTFYPWPYVEGLTMAEATHELAFIVTGAYGKPLLKQYGTPLRLATPWKYGFKQIKSIVNFSFTEDRPKTFWEIIAPSEYGFWANVNPGFSHPRWSQSSERDLATEERVATKLYNGYGEFVASLYEDMPQDRRLFM